MNHKRPMRLSSGHDANMYDDEPWANEYERRSSPQGYHNAPKDNSRAPLRGPAGENMYASTSAGRNYNSEGRSRRDERSRSPRREGRSRYTDRDREDYQSPARRSRSRSRSRSPYFGGPPSRTIILEGLSLEMTQEDLLGFWLSIGFGRFGHRFGIQISNELQHSLRVEGLEEVRLIRDKKTGLSRQFAFAQFASLHEARRFLDRHFPTISLYGGYVPSQATDSEPTKVRVSFSREKDERDKPGKSEDDWKCEVCYLANYSHRALCFRCNAPRMRATAQGVVVAQTNMSSFSGFATTGDSDTSPDSTASQFILLRGLEPGVTEELLAKGVSKLYKTKVGTPSTDLQPPKKTKISSTSNDGTLGAKVGSLRRVLLIRDRKTNDSWRYGFAEFSSVEDAQAAMTKYKASEKFTISSKPVLLSYIHAGVFVPVLHVIDAELAQFTFSPLSNPSVKLMYWDEAAYACEYVTASTAPTSTVNNEKESKHARLAAAAANEGLLIVGKEGEPKAKKRKVEKDAPPGSKKVVAPHLQFWTNRHAELHGIVPKDDESAASGPVPAPKKGAVLDDSPPAQSFADLERKCCLLCSRQFKTESEIHKHERISQLHRDNMKNEELVAKAMAKLTKSNETGTDNSVYRDRAKERRQAFNQPKQPAAQHHRTPKDAETDSNQNKDTEKPAPVQSKGAALLGKMGWTAGEGLGAQGTGRTEAIATELYSQGVGLGAQGGKVGDAVDEAQRQTKGSYAEFLSKTKDKAKERFENLG